MRAGCQWLVIVILAYYGSVTEVGKLTASLALTGVLFVLLSFGMRNVYLTHGERLSIQWYLRTRFLLLVLAGSLSILFAIISGNYELRIVALVCATKLVEATADMLFVADQEGGRQGLVGLVMLLLGLGAVAGFTFGYLLTGSLVVGQVMWLGVNMVTTAAYFFYVRRHYPTKYFGRSARWPKSVIVAGLNSGIAQATATAQVSLPVLLLNQFSTPGEVGVFSLIFYFVTVFNLTASGFQQQALPGLVSEKNGGRRWARYTTVLLGGSLAVGLGAVMTGPWLMGVLYGGGQTTPAGAFVIVALAILANSWSLISSSRLLVAQRYRAQMLSGILGTAATFSYCMAVGTDIDVQHALASVAIGYLIRGVVNSISLCLGARRSQSKPGSRRETEQ